MNYKEILTETMNWLGKQEYSIFLGQGVGHKVGGTFMSSTFDSVPEEKKIEFIVDEQLQMQFSLGLSIEKYIVISSFPRQNFLLLGLGDLINVLDKVSILSEQEFIPHVIIRTAVGTTSPIYPGIQHSGHFHDQIKNMLETTSLCVLDKKEKIFSAYKNAYNNKGIHILVEFGDLYNE